MLLYAPLAFLTEAGVSSVYRWCAIVVDAGKDVIFRLGLRKCDRIREAL